MNLAPNGKPSNLTPEQYRLVRTPAFKAWFGDWENSPETASKVVDENGEPLVVNHTYETEKAPNIFQKSKEVYIDGKYKRIFENDDIYQKLEGIYGNTIIDGVKYDVASDYWEFWFTNKIFGEGFEDEVKYISCFLNIKNLYVSENGGGGQGSFGGMTSDYDGISGIKITNADGQDGMDYYIVLFSNQIKLADGTNTTFDSNNPDIRYAEGGSVRPFDDGNKLVVFSTYRNYEPYKIAVNDINNADYITLWKTDTNTGKDKKVGALKLEDTTIGRNSFFSNSQISWLNNTDFLKVSYIEIDKSSRGLGLGLEMYKVALKYSADNIKGIKSYLPDRVNKRQIPKIYKALNGKIEDNDYAYIYKADNIGKFKKGGAVKNLSKTPAPKKDRIYGSSKNKPKSSESKSKASSIILNPTVLKSINTILKEHNEDFPKKKVPLSTAKAVVRRGMGAFSSSYRPTISGGKPNSRVAWGLARLKAFVYKIQKGYSKSGKYKQDNDLIQELGYKYKEYKKGGEVVYHGSPYDFQEFTTSTIGTGEGASGWGYGLYFTEDKDEANDYACKLEREKKDGRIYTAKIPESEKFLDFHADFDEQTDYVKKALISMPKKYKIELSEGEYQENLESINEDIDEYDFKIGDDDYWELINYVLEPHILFKQNYIYDWIKHILFEGYEYETSEFLYKLGIKGVKHSAFGNVNYVVFNEDDIKLLNKNIAKCRYKFGGKINPNEVSKYLKNNNSGREMQKIDNLYKEHHEVWAKSEEIIKNVCEENCSKYSTEIYNLYETDLKAHFVEEEQVFFPSVINENNKDLIKELIREHHLIKFLVQKIRLSKRTKDIKDFCNLMIEHIRKEELIMKTISNDPYKDMAFKNGGLTMKVPSINKMPSFIAPNGERSNLMGIKEYDENGRWVYLYDIVRTAAFKNWFGDWEEAYRTKDYERVSKIIDENGEPSVCYHVTSNEFYEFDENYIGSKTDSGYYGKGFYFTEGTADSHYGEREIPCFLNIRNPLSYKSINRTNVLDTNELKDKGYDGVLVFPNYVDVESIDLTKGLGYHGNNIQEIVAYYPEQIKLADATNTTFDKYDSDIRYNEGGNIPMKEEYKYFLVIKNQKPVFKVKFSEYRKETERDMSEMLDKLHDMDYSLKPITEQEYKDFDYGTVDKEDIAEFTKNWSYYKNGGKITDEKKETYKKWKSLVNMSSSELNKFLDSEEGKVAGLSRKEANELGIDYGRESARWILRMKDTPYSEWTPNMWRWAKKQISFISRMSGNKGKLFDENGKRTRKYLSLLVWGNNPLKK
jgi:hypothetical protein